MTWAIILFYGWLTLGWLPMGGMATYQPPIYTSLEGSGIVEMGGEATWGPFFAGGAMRVSIWAAGEGGFWPSSLESTVDFGVKWENVRLGYLRVCTHPVAPLLGAFEWSGRTLSPAFDSAYGMIYLRIEGGKR